MNKTAKNFTGVVLAADRGPGDLLALTAGAPCKSFVPLGGKPMVLRVLDTLAGAREIDSLIVCGPSESLLPREPELLSRINAGKIRWIPPQATPSASTYHVLERLSPEAPVLVTTADHAFLTAEVVDFFCSKARATGCDVVAGLAPHEQVTRAFPQTKRTAIRLRDGDFCSCNLFAFLTPRAKNAAEFWRQCERNRKKPWRMMRVIGWQVVVRYLLGALSLEEGLRRLSSRMNVKAGVIIMPFPEAAVDVDTVSDWRLVEEVLAGRG
ncbi:MAG: MobA-like transferase domain containing protein [Deltaproteobacteria bacterium]|nr:MobA-like transferase domain containing protein [Deltaproteobacteria bacterium]